RPFHSGILFEGDGIQIWNGNFFSIKQSWFPEAGYGVYDRAGFVAFPPQKRRLLAEKYNELWENETGILLHGFDYNQEEMNGPPFSVPADELKNHFQGKWRLTLLDEFSRLESLNKFRQKGLSKLMEQTWWLDRM
ncbi:MAG: hypothetical protein V2J13_11015, partial [Cycloclasticus sp.]|nr:hypothetical protein [Cycloclasticus sp.]